MNKILKYKEYIISSAAILIICLFMFGKVLFSGYEFLPPDSYSAKAVEQGFHLSEKQYDQYPLWLPWMFSGLPSVHSFQNISDYYYPYKIFKILRNFGLLRFYEFILEDSIFFIVFSFCGFILKHFKISRPAVLLGFILSERLEQFSYQLIDLYSFQEIIIRPFVIIIMLLSILMVIFSKKVKVDYV